MPPRNPGTSLDLAWIEAAAAGRYDALGAERLRLRPPEPSRVLLAISCLDLTSLNGDDTRETVARLCEKAHRPNRPHVAAVCVYPVFIPEALAALRGTGVSVAAVAGGFPHGLSPLPLRVGEVRASVEAGAQEVDVVIRRSHVLEGEWTALYDEIRAFREAAGNILLKVILATGELRTLDNVAKASLVAMMAGADFIKTSTGKEAVNATLRAGQTMAHAIRVYESKTGIRVGLKPAGGIRVAGQALDWIRLVENELGEDWLTPNLFRIGASSLLEDLERFL